VADPALSADVCRDQLDTLSVVIAALVPAIAIMEAQSCLPKRDGRDGAPRAPARGDPDKPGHDELRVFDAKRSSIRLECVVH
jgi:hypothetical protein